MFNFFSGLIAVSTIRYLLLFFVFQSLAGSCFAAGLWPDRLATYNHVDFEDYTRNLTSTQTRAVEFAVASEKQRFAASGHHLFGVTKRSRWFAKHIVDRCIQRGLPIELALLPMVESAFDPFAFSQGGAVGLWQFMPATGREYGLDGDWWFDERRDAIESTEAALDYLGRLHRRFDDWLLAVAAYNAGPTRISRAIKRSKALGQNGNYWELQLPEETARYVPRLLALRDMLLKRGLADVDFYEVPLGDAFVQVVLPGQIDLAEAAEFAEVSVQTLYALNPGLNRWATPPNGPHRLLVPIESELAFQTALASRRFQNRLLWNKHTIKYGDTLGEIAASYGTRIELIKLANSLETSEITVGKHLMVPSVASGAKLSSAELSEKVLRMKEVQQGIRRVEYTVVSGDSWWTVAKKFSVSIRALKEWNGSQGDLLRQGRELTVWQPVEKNRRDIHRTIYYRVKSGDSLSRIASRFDVPVAHIAKNNDIQSGAYLQPGQKLSIRVKVAGD